MITKIFKICKSEGLMLKSICFEERRTLLFRGTCDADGNIKINLLIPFVDYSKKGRYCRVKKEHQEEYGAVVMNCSIMKDILLDTKSGGINYRFDNEEFLETIAHEIAHLKVKRHSQEHTNYTKLIKKLLK